MKIMLNMTIHDSQRIGHLSQVLSHWLLIILKWFVTYVYCLLYIGNWPLVTGHCSLITSRSRIKGKQKSRGQKSQVKNNMMVVTCLGH